MVSIFSKVIEVVICKQLLLFLDYNKLLCTEQFGFHRRLSTSHAIINLIDIILKCFEGKDLAATFYDLSKAFILVPYDILLDKLHFYHIRGTSLNIFKTYLSYRQQYVYAGRGCSTCLLVVSSRVPQGSVLGLLLLVIMINDVM